MSDTMLTFEESSVLRDAISKAIAAAVDQSGLDPMFGELFAAMRGAEEDIFHKLGLKPCPVCGADLASILFMDPWFKAIGGHPGDSGPGGNTPQDPVAWGTQTCPECKATFHVEG